MKAGLPKNQKSGLLWRKLFYLGGNIMHDAAFRKKSASERRKNICLTPKNFILFFSFLMFPSIIQMVSHSIGKLYGGILNCSLNIIFLVTVSVTLYCFLRKLEKQTMKLEHIANHDALTGLPNNRMLCDYLQKSLARCKLNNRELAVLFLDLDRFKVINDTKGHEVGDVLLQQVAIRLLENVRDVDVVARQGGDEFIIILEETNGFQAKVIAQRIIDSFYKAFLLDNEEFFISPSIGISLYPKDGNDNESLIKNADAAMYVAKKLGKNNF